MQKIYLAFLHSIGLSHKKMHEIFKSNSNYKDFFDGINIDVLEKYGISYSNAKIILENKDKLNKPLIERKLKQRNVEIVTFFDKEYPEQLKQAPNKPFLFYLRGKLPKINCIAVVGARKITDYGKTVIEKIVPEIASKFCIVSGGAAGCDSEAHKASIDSFGKTLSVIGTGIDQDYPVSNNTLYDKIVEKGGGVMSIFPVGTPGNPYNFPVRNEIVVAMSVGILVIEAEEKSGSLITANLALDLGRDLFAIPGEIFKPRSAGCNKLISNGEAKLVTDSFSILSEYGFENSKINQNIKFSDKLEENIYKLLSLEALNIDTISKKLSIDISNISLKLSMMELGGLIKKTNSGKYMLN